MSKPATEGKKKVHSYELVNAALYLPLKPIEKLCLACLLTHYPNMRPSLNRLARMMGRTTRTVIRCLESLQKKGLISVHKGRKGLDANTYTVHTAEILKRASEERRKLSHTKRWTSTIGVVKPAHYPNEGGSDTSATGGSDTSVTGGSDTSAVPVELQCHTNQYKETIQRNISQDEIKQETDREIGKQEVSRQEDEDIGALLTKAPIQISQPCQEDRLPWEETDMESDETLTPIPPLLSPASPLPSFPKPEEVKAEEAESKPSEDGVHRKSPRLSDSDLRTGDWIFTNSDKHREWYKNKNTGETRVHLLYPPVMTAEQVKERALTELMTLVSKLKKIGAPDSFDEAFFRHTCKQYGPETTLRALQKFIETDPYARAGQPLMSFAGYSITNLCEEIERSKRRA